MIIDRVSPSVKAVDGVVTHITTCMVTLLPHSTQRNCKPVQHRATEEILQKMACEQERLRVPLPCGNYQDLYQPASGDENSLILMYGAFRANLPDRLFDEREDLQQFWPHIHRVKGGEVSCIQLTVYHDCFVPLGYAYA